MAHEIANCNAENKALEQSRRKLVCSVEDASEDGDLERVKYLMDQWRSNISFSGPEAEDLREALSCAVTHDRPIVVSYLLDQGAEIDKFIMLEPTTIPVWQAFLDHGWDINSRSVTGAPVLKHLVTDIPTLKWFLEHGADPNIHGAKGECALDTAVNSLSFEGVELLLKHGAKIEQSNALHAAAGARSSDPRFIPMMAYLLDHGADINALEDQGNPEYFEKMKTHVRVSLKPPIQCAAYRRHNDRVQFLLERGADPNVLNTHGFGLATKGYDQTEMGKFIKRHSSTST